jgi:4a-hydroxytetrahydrobiopterin dehydratase
VEFPRASNGEPLQAFAQSADRAATAASTLLSSHRPEASSSPLAGSAVAGAGLAPHNGWRERQPILEECTMPAKKLTDAEISALLPKTKGWSLVNGKLHREFACKDFVTAFGNMTRVALVAEAMNHHPEWSNVWNKVVIDLNTHSVKGISDYDFTLAEKINEIFGA